jgi:hypothetical protein
MDVLVTGATKNEATPAGCHGVFLGVLDSDGSGNPADPEPDSHVPT